MLGGILWIHPLPIAMAQAPAFHNLDPLKLILTLSSHPTLLCLITCLVLSHTPPCNKICHHIESIPLHQWCQLELGSCHHTAVQPLDSMEIACLYALCGVLGVKANKIHGMCRMHKVNRLQIFGLTHSCSKRSLILSLSIISSLAWTFSSCNVGPQ